MTDPGRGRARAAGLLALVAVAAAAWALRDDLRGVWAGMTGAGDRPAAEAPAGGRAAPAGSAAGDVSAAGAAVGERADSLAERAPNPAGREEDAGAGAAAPAPGGADGPDREAARSGDRSAPTADPAQRLQRLFGPGGSGEVRLDSADLAMLLGPGRTRPLPAGVSDPRAVPRDSVLEASADLDLATVMGDRLPAMIRRMIGDSTRVTAVMTPEVPARGVLRVRVRSVQAGSTTFPRGMVPWLLRQTGLPTATDDPTAVELRPGGGLTGARVEDGALVLTRDPGG